MKICTSAQFLELLRTECSEGLLKMPSQLWPCPGSRTQEKPKAGGIRGSRGGLELVIFVSLSSLTPFPGP